jgi:hypothetical protein
MSYFARTNMTSSAFTTTYSLQLYFTAMVALNIAFSLYSVLHLGRCPTKPILIFRNTEVPTDDALISIGAAPQSREGKGGCKQKTVALGWFCLFKGERIGGKR